VNVIIGREQELGAVEAFVAGQDDRPASLLIEGEAGSGKTTLWLAGCEAARSAGDRVLVARPLQAETGFAFAGIADLLTETTEVIAELPDPQERALRVALLLESAGESPADERAVGLGLLGVLQRLALVEPVVVAVDDIQWLDGPSARVLMFAAHRLDAAEVGFLITLRLEERSRLAIDPERALPRLTRIRVPPLAPEDVHHLIRARLGRILSPPTLREIHATSGGNPLFALELARALPADSTDRRSGGRIVVPKSLRDLVGARISELPDETRDVLLLASALADPALDVVSTAAGADAKRALEPAVAAEVVELDHGRVRFTHPLLAAAAYEGSDAERRRAAHAVLAQLAVGPEERARHLALAAEGPDATVADQLDEAARAARARGAPVVAGELAQLAAELTPPADEEGARRRHLDAAFWIFEAGDARRARPILERLVESTQPGAERARALVQLAAVRSYDDDISAARALYLAAVEEAADDDEMRLRAHEGVAGTSFRLRDRLPESVEHASEAAALAQAIGRRDLLGAALASKALSEAILGRPAASANAAAALAMQGESEQQRITSQPGFAMAVVEFWHDDLDGATARFHALTEQALVIGDESSIPYLRVMLGQIECVRGRFDEAIELTEGELEHARQAGQETLVAYLLGVAAWARAYAGDEEGARASTAQSLALAERTSGVPAWFFATSALGQLELARGDSFAAHDALEPLVAFTRRQGMCEPGATWCVGDAIEAHIGLDRPLDAEALLDWYEANADRLQRLSAQAVARRYRGLLAAGAGDLPRAVASLEEALELHARCPRPLEEARTLLALGSVQRRAKERRVARETLERAGVSFDAVGARLWGERTEAELARIGGRAPSAGGLTPVEQRVVALVAEGRSNKEVAAALFLSVRTVEGHLSRAYGKLGVRSRVGLARRLGDRAPKDSKVE
jgi:DNA-binding CsgD family transcriptional regulator